MRAKVESFIGVGVKVSFSGEGETSMTKRLSGGQKDIVALALILAIQRSDPAPFYLFDELDAALDDVRRAAVAALISKQAHDEENPVQFITSTFRPELVNVADQHVGVSLSRKASVLRLLDKKEAASFMMQTKIKNHAAHGAGKLLVVGDGGMCLFTFCSRCLVLLTFDFLQFLFFLSVTNQGDYSNEDEADDEDDEEDLLLVAQSKKRSRPYVGGRGCGGGWGCRRRQRRRDEKMKFWRGSTKI
jgi:hypothetical protein